MNLNFVKNNIPKEIMPEEKNAKLIPKIMNNINISKEDKRQFNSNGIKKLDT